MDIVTLVVRHSILNFFSIFPSRLHVLGHIFLTNGNGYDWVYDKDADLFTIKHFDDANCDFSTKNSIERAKIDKSCDIKGLMESSTGDQFNNHIAQFIEDNIDVYASKAFYTKGLNLNPKKPHQFSRDCNLYCKLPPIDMIHPDWLDAMHELAEFEMSLRNPHGGSVSKSRVLDIMTRDHRDWVDGYKILLRFCEKYKDHQNSDLARSHEQMMNSIFPENSLEQRYADFEQKQEITFDEFKSLNEYFVNSDDFTYFTYTNWLSAMLRTRQQYITDGQLNSQFREDAEYVLCNSGLLNRYNNYSTMSYQIKRGLEISSYFMPLVDQYVADVGTHGLIGL
ncbi:hypothetical protein [Photobacterium leiognathi]|uniref:hypothetical protein n=1 Tax=Photobacterium leiognathi TaxID=553611 RepID=UPI0029826157|nr:hypothetical protein [Photobacterium leiognathi]